MALDLVLTKLLGVSSHLMPVGWMWIMLFGRFPQARLRKPVKGFSPPGTRGGLLSAIVSRKINEWGFWRRNLCFEVSHFVPWFCMQKHVFWHKIFLLCYQI